MTPPENAAPDLSRFARDTPDEPFDMTDAMERDGCTRKGLRSSDVRARVGGVLPVTEPDTAATDAEDR